MLGAAATIRRAVAAGEVGSALLGIGGGQVVVGGGQQHKEVANNLGRRQ